MFATRACDTFTAYVHLKHRFCLVVTVAESNAQNPANNATPTEAEVAGIMLLIVNLCVA